MSVALIFQGCFRIPPFVFHRVIKRHNCAVSLESGVYDSCRTSGRPGPAYLSRYPSDFHHQPSENRSVGKKVLIPVQ